MPESIVELDSESRPELKTISFPHLTAMASIAVSTFFVSLLVSSAPFLLVPVFLIGSVGTLFCYHLAQKKIELSQSPAPPHKVYPKVLKWKGGDRISVDDPYDSGGHWNFSDVVDGYFQGVLDDYSLLISDKRTLENSENTYRVSANTLKIAESALFSTGVKNKSLTERRKEKKKDNAKELLENSDYDKMLNEIKSEFNTEKLTA